MPEISHRKWVERWMHVVRYTNAHDCSNVDCFLFHTDLIDTASCLFNSFGDDNNNTTVIFPSFIRSPDFICCLHPGKNQNISKIKWKNRKNPLFKHWIESKFILCCRMTIHFLPFFSITCPRKSGRNPDFAPEKSSLFHRDLSWCYKYVHWHHLCSC